MTPEESARKNKRLGLVFMAVVFGMLGLTFASVPLYRMFCQVTGYGGTPQINPGAVSEKVISREMTVRFNGDVAQGMPWTFKPEQDSITLKIGQKGLTSFYARNTATEAVEGTAIYNVLPEAVGPYFHKTQCFCFGRQTLEPGAEANMPVVFFIDPKIVDDPDLKDIKTITLSYTFFKADSKALEDALEDVYNTPNTKNP